MTIGPNRPSLRTSFGFVTTRLADKKRSIQQGYPVAVCSDQGFTMDRDATGRCRPQGQWMHCMAIIGVRTNPEGAFILNSWGDNAHTGTVWPADAPVAGFWADASVVDRMMRQGDSFALADVAGFPQRPKPPLDWTVRGDSRMEIGVARKSPIRDGRFPFKGIDLWGASDVASQKSDWASVW
jgi:hypothetical protein